MRKEKQASENITSSEALTYERCNCSNIAHGCFGPWRIEPEFQAPSTGGIAVSIQAKHAYRFGYLRSEQWKCVRLEALAREDGKCEICIAQSTSNDAHHIWYPDSIYETKSSQLAILCRECHSFVHAMLPECKTKDELKARTQWMTLKSAILQWRASKMALFMGTDSRQFIAQVSKSMRHSKIEYRLGDNSGAPIYHAAFSIHVADHMPEKRDKIYSCGTALRLSRLVDWLQESIPSTALRIPDGAVIAVWHNKRRARKKKDLQSLDAQVFMVEAAYLKEIPFSKPEWNPDIIIRANAASAYLSALPDDWPCFTVKTHSTLNE